MMKLRLEAPWYSFQKKVEALFKDDPDILVGELIETDDEFGFDYVMNIEVLNHKKFEALDRVVAPYKIFGDIIVKIVLFDEENHGVNPGLQLYETIFEGNSILEDVRNITDQAGVTHGYVRFKPEVIQFFDDNIGDYDGNWSGLAESIARELFENDTTGMHFCTAAKTGNQTLIGK